MKIGQ